MQQVSHPSTGPKEIGWFSQGVRPGGGGSRRKRGIHTGCVFDLILLPFHIDK